MADYMTMYQKLCKAQARAVELLEQSADILKKAHQETEEMYISAPEDNVTVLKNPDACEPDSGNKTRQ